MLVTPAFAQDAAAAGGATAMILQLAPMLLIFGVFYFLLIRPQQKRAREQKALLAAIKRGDRVVTAGGILGTVARVKDGVDELEVDIAPNVRVSVLRATIADVLKPVAAEAAAPAVKAS